MNKSNITSLVEEFNKTGITSSTHYIRSVENEIPIISNVFPEVYDSDFMKPYSPPKTFKKQVELLKSIQGYIDQIQELHLDTGSNGYLFQLNECHSNSKRLFSLVKYLQKQKLVSKKDKAEIVFGYISMLIPFGTLVGNVMVECEHVILHEWHVWNYMNGCLTHLLQLGDLFCPKCL